MGNGMPFAKKHKTGVGQAGLGEKVKYSILGILSFRCFLDIQDMVIGVE